MSVLSPEQQTIYDTMTARKTEAPEKSWQQIAREADIPYHKWEYIRAKAGGAYAEGKYKAKAPRALRRRYAKIATIPPEEVGEPPEGATAVAHGPKTVLIVGPPEVIKQLLHEVL